MSARLEYAMTTGQFDQSDSLSVAVPEATLRRLPSRMGILCAGTVEPSWVNLTLQLDAAGCTEPQFRWNSTPSEVLAQLREESFDCVIICGAASQRLSSDLELRSWESLVRAISASGCEDPIVYIVPQTDDELWLRLRGCRCEPLVTHYGWDSRAVVPVIQRAVERAELIRENYRLSVSDQRRLTRERDEAQHLLDQQRQIVHDLELLAGSFGSLSTESSARRTGELSPFGLENETLEAIPVSADIKQYYDELLRAYVIMGSGNLGGEISRLAELLAVALPSPRRTLQLHLERLESLVRGLGNRSTRHIMARADLLALEIMIHLAECYQRQKSHGSDDGLPTAA